MHLQTVVRTLALVAGLLLAAGARASGGTKSEALLRRASALRASGRSVSALQLLRAARATHPLDSALENLRGDLHTDLEQFQAAGLAYTLAYARAYQEGDLARAATAANNQGLLLSICAHVVYGRPAQGGRCELHAAVKWFQQALTLRLELGDSPGALRSSNNLGMVRFALGHYPQAKEDYARSAALARGQQDFSRLRLAEASRSLVVLFEGFGQEVCESGDLGSQPGWRADGILRRARRHLRDAHRAGEMAGEPSSLVCETFGLYRRSCWALEQAMPGLTPRR